MVNNISYTLIVNWKMYFSFNQALQWIKINKDQLSQACKQSSNKLIICPSFESIYPIKLELANSQISLGAQDCSNHEQGAFTGQVSAQSLTEIGCSYCIIGHSERRQYQQENNEEIAQKLQLLLQNNINPILCIGESKQDYEQGKTEEILQKQLEPITKILNSIESKNTIYIAYEPIWSIGTGITPENDYLEAIFNFIKKSTQTWPNSPILLYGGSVNENTCKKLKEVSLIQGFLIGKASTDFQMLKKIVL